ncbi:hypothetical protein KUTeg_000104 [Tegillarca granosa]|uniref:1-phosphatidylinositol-3-phosphate 5-kinase n=1 Tax=Tegillarca granosa TaxID=220873 RepID=A0ABQ9FWK1_TEGGR|nr:hypothetical protein KUTeg_000104 [Tegillarca granosa]
MNCHAIIHQRMKSHQQCIDSSPQSSSNQSESQKSSRETSSERDVVLPRHSSITSSTGSISEKDEGETQEKEVPMQQDTTRTLSSVLNRLSNILERRPMTPQAYKDSDFKQYWMPDSSCKECYDCGDKFTTFRRRHHCRICGQIFCSKCCNQELPGKIIGYKGGIRVCTYCGKVALSALQSEPSGDFQVDREDLGLSIDGEHSSEKRISRIKQVNIYQNENHQVINSDFVCLNPNFKHLNYMASSESAQLRELWRQLQDPEKGVEMQSHRIRLRTYHKCIVGNRLVDWLMKHDRATQRLQAVVIGQALLDAGYLEVVSESESNAEHHDFFLSTSSNNKLTTSTGKMTQSRRSEDEDIKEFEPLPRQDTAGFTSSQSTTSDKMISSHLEWRGVESMKEENGEKMAYTRLNLVNHMVGEEGLSKSWIDIIYRTAERISTYVRPDVKQEGDDMDVRKYVHFKKIPGGNKEQTFMVHGVVFTKNIAHKKMSQQITNPRILLLKGSIEYQREEEFLKKSIAKITSLNPRPDVIIVEKTVSRLAQEYLLQDGGTKTVLIFDGCATHLGCTVMLRGGTKSELKRIKKIMKAMVYAAYHSQLEISFCMDEFAVPPAGEDSVMYIEGFDNSEELSFDKETFMNHKINNSEKGKCSDKGPSNNVDKSISVVESGCDLVSLVTLKDELYASEKKDQNTIQQSQDLMRNKPKLYGDNKDLKTEKSLQNEVEIQSSIESGKMVKKVLSLEDSHHEISESKNQKENEEEFIGSFKLAFIGDKVDVSKIDKDSNNKETAEVDQSEIILGTEHVTDQSDPLHTYQKNQDDTIFSSSLTLQEKTFKHSQKFTKVLDEVILTTSPFVKYKIPYLESEAGSKCINRKYFPDEIYMSRHFESKTTHRKSKFVDNEYTGVRTYSWSNIEITEAHPFILSQLTSALSDTKTQSMLADFRARGGRIKLKQPVSPITILKEQDQSIKNGHLQTDKKDCCDFNRHQRLAVLLSSNSEKSANHPYPCLPPQESYSCQPYTCPSEACDVPMLDHVRRIVHSDGSMYISLRKLTHSATPLVPMSRDTWNISFAKYLELRFHCPEFTRRASAEPCSHSLHHNCSQYFGHRNIVATFKYYPISKLEVALPPSVIFLQENITKFQWMKLKEEVKYITNKGTDMYCLVLENVVTLNNEKADFRAMTDSNRERLNEVIAAIERTDSSTAGTNQFFIVNDEITKMKRFLTDAVMNWNTKLQELYNQNKKHRQSIQSKRDKDVTTSTLLSADDSDKQLISASPKQSLQDCSDFPIVENYTASVESNVYSVTPGITAASVESSFETNAEIVNTDNLNKDISTMVTKEVEEDNGIPDQDAVKNKSLNSKSVAKYNAKGTDLKKTGSMDDLLDVLMIITKSYKKYKHILQYHRRKPKDTGKKSTGGRLSFLRMPNKDSSPKLSRKGGDNVVDTVKYIKTDGESLEIEFSDSSARFYCKFRKLRKLIFPSGEDLYIRSLSRCKIWEAKGGKSGSAFCKTNDDRFILKQMSGIEVEIFEKFGPEYFQYISKSYQEKVRCVYCLTFIHKAHSISKDCWCVQNWISKHSNKCSHETGHVKI